MRKFDTPAGIAQLRKALDVIKAHGGRVTIGDVAHECDVSATTAGRYMMVMANAGCIRALPRVENRQAVYVLVDESRMPKERAPLSSAQVASIERLAFGAKNHGLSAHRSVRITKAKQIGLQRDPLIAALFGQPAQVQS
jgi:hypothetical protein